MTRSRIIGIVALLAGILIVLVKIGADGLSFSFVLALGLLCIVDGVLRLAERPNGG